MLAVWTQTDGTSGNIWANRLSSRGWGTAVHIESDATNARLPQVAVDSFGNGIAVWQQIDRIGRFNIYANRFVVASGWGTATLVETDNSGSTADRKLVIDPSGTGTAVWWRDTGNQRDIFANTFD